MAQMADSPDGIDALLIAYIDGKLESVERASVEARIDAEPALKGRLDQLSRGSRDFAGAYAALLSAAPEARLQARLAELAVQHRQVSATSHVGGRRWFASLAAALVIFALGGAAGYVLPLLAPHEPPGWRQIVAEYQGLTTSETLAAIPDDPAATAQELAAAGGKLSLELTADNLAIPDAMLKRAQLFEFRGRPLAQIAYLSPSDGPIALCIIASGRPNAPRAFEVREGFNIVFWNDDGRGYMLIGKAPREELEAYAGSLAARV